MGRTTWAWWSKQENYFPACSVKLMWKLSFQHGVKCPWLVSVVVLVNTGGKIFVFLLYLRIRALCPGWCDGNYSLTWSTWGTGGRIIERKRGKAEGEEECNIRWENKSVESGCESRWGEVEQKPWWLAYQSMRISRQNLYCTVRAGTCTVRWSSLHHPMRRQTAERNLEISKVVNIWAAIFAIQHLQLHLHIELN